MVFEGLRSFLPLFCCVPGVILRYGTSIISAKIQVHKCPATREKKSSVKTDLYIRFLGKRLKEALSFHSILSLRFSVESGALSGGGCG